MKKHVIYISERRYPNGNAGGVRTYNISQILKNFYDDVTVISFGSQTNDVEVGTLDGVKFINFKQKRFNKLLNSFSIFFCLLNFNFSYVSQVYIYSSNPIFIFFTTFVLKFKKVRYSFDVVEDFSINEDVSSLKRFLSKINNSFYSVPNNIVISKKYMPLYENCIYVPSTYKKSLRKFVYEEGRPIHLAYFGDPFDKEDVFFMFDFILNLIELNPNVYFHGTGFKKDRVLEYKNSNKLLSNPNVKLYGWLSNFEYSNLFDKMHFLFFYRLDKNSNYYNFPTKLSEFASHGKIPICNYVGDYADYLDDSNSILVNDINDVQKINDIVNDNVLVNKLSMSIYETSRKYLCNETFNFKLK